MTVKLTENQRDVLNELDAANHYGEYTVAWARPLDIGASNSSHHSATLKALVAKGLVERKQRGVSDDMIGKGPRECNMSRGSWCYRISAKGRAVLTALKTASEAAA